MNDEWFLSRYRQMKIVLGSADWDICLDQNVKFSAMLKRKRCRTGWMFWEIIRSTIGRCGRGWRRIFFGVIARWLERSLGMLRR